MTHHTDAERAEFEAWARSVGLPVDRAGFGLYAKVETQAAWMAWQWQAARRAPAAPVPQGWRYVPEVLTPEMKREFMDMLMDGIDIYMNSNDQIEIQTDAPRRIWKSILAAAPQPPEAAPVQLPEYGIDTANHAGIRVRGYTEQQVRELLANHGIQEQNT